MQGQSWKHTFWSNDVMKDETAQREHTGNLQNQIHRQKTLGGNQMEDCQEENPTEKTNKAKLRKQCCQSQEISILYCEMQLDILFTFLLRHTIFLKFFG